MATSGLAVLSAGALRVGVSRCVEAFAGNVAEVRFATAPELRAEVEAAAHAFDVVIAPAPLQREFAAAGRTLADSIVRVGSIRAGVVVHRDAPVPDLATPEALARALRAAGKVVYNVASSGQSVERMLQALGLTAELAEKIERVPTGAAVMEAVANGPGANGPGAGIVGFGQGTEIRRLAHLGIKLAGPLPGPLDTVTVYDAALGAAVPRPEPATAFIAFLAGAEAKALLRETGID